MEQNWKHWLGSWENFEDYFSDTDPQMLQAWADAEEICRTTPVMAKIFRGGCKNFWIRSCRTVTEGNPVRLGGWKVADADENGPAVEWLAADGDSLGCCRYHRVRVIARGLEGCEMLLMEAEDAPEGWPFRWLLTTGVMTDRDAKREGGLLSHMHIQYAARLEQLLQGERLRDYGWYATICDAEATMEQRCAIVLALHQPHIWERMAALMERLAQARKRPQ